MKLEGYQCDRCGLQSKTWEKSWTTHECAKGDPMSSAPIKYALDLCEACSKDFSLFLEDKKK